MRSNEHGQPIGRELPQWGSRPSPERIDLVGRHASVVPLDASRHTSPLLAAFSEADSALWTYLPYGPFDLDSLQSRLERWESSHDPLFFTITARDSGPAGWAALQRVDRVNGVLEVGNVCYAPVLSRTTAATEAMWLLAHHAFDTLGYRRYEWKCDALNAASRTAAERLGFHFEGVFRNHMVYRNRNRDTAWYSITAEEWPGIDRAIRAWLDPANQIDGRQQQPLSDFMSV